MKNTLMVGITMTRRWAIDEVRTIGFMGREGRVYATPRLIQDIEETCRDFLLEYLDPREDSLGTHIEMAHMAPTLLGMWVDVTITVASVQGRAVQFDVIATDELEQVARGSHARFIADVEKTKGRLRAKAEMVAERLAG